MKTKTNLKAGNYPFGNHNEMLLRDVPKARPLKVKAHVKAGGGQLNHNETLVHDSGR